MQQYFYDIEIYPNVFMVTFIGNVNQNIIDAYIQADINGDFTDKSTILTKLIKPIVFIIEENGRNDYDLFMDFMISHKILIGYNNNNYDNLILDYLYYFRNRYNQKLKSKTSNNTLNQDLYKISQDIIGYGKGYNRIFYNEHKIFNYMKPYTAYDIQRILYLDKSFTSLKQVAIQLKWYRIQDLPYPYDQPLNAEQTIFVKDYNINDVLITKQLFDSQINEIKLRNDISEEYEINVRNHSRSGMANVLASKFYSDITGEDRRKFIDLRSFRHSIHFETIISEQIKFNSEELILFLNNLKQHKQVLGGSSFKAKVFFKDTVYTFATGGLHSKDDPKIFNSTETIKYTDCDVND